MLRYRPARAMTIRKIPDAMSFPFNFNFINLSLPASSGNFRHFD
jgi:hypothetical protein